MQSAAKTYFQTQFSTMGQGELLLLLYDGALKFLAQAKEKIVEKDYGGKGILISKSLDIIAELDAALNPEAGGPLVENLHQLYFICSMRLLKANLKMDIELIDSVIGVLHGLRSAYAEILNRPEAQAASQQIADKRKYYNIKGTATITNDLAPSHGGGGRAQVAYTVAASQVVPAAVPASPAAPQTTAPSAAPALEPAAPAATSAGTTSAGTTPAAQASASVGRSASAAYGRITQLSS